MQQFKHLQCMGLFPSRYSVGLVLLGATALKAIGLTCTWCFLPQYHARMLFSDTHMQQCIAVISSAPGRAFWTIVAGRKRALQCSTLIH